MDELDNFDHFLQIIHTLNMITTNYSSSLEPFMYNKTDLESIALSHHPILYGAAIYALFLIIIGTLGKLILNF